MNESTSQPSLLSGGSPSKANLHKEDYHDGYGSNDELRIVKEEEHSDE